MSEHDEELMRAIISDDYEEEWPTAERMRAEARMDWYLQRMAEVRARHEREVHTAQERISIIDGWLSEQRERATRATQYLEGQIRNCMAEIDLGRRKSIELPYGRVGFRKRRATVDIQDRPAAIRWAQENLPGAVRERVTLDLVKTPLIEHIQAGGTIDHTAGIVAVPEADVMYIDVRGDVG